MRPRRFLTLADGSSVQQFIRFGIVGAVAISIPALSFAVSPAAGALIASFVSVSVSYYGHHKITFAKVGNHAVYLPRFLLSSAVLSGAAVAATYVATQTFLIDYRLTSFGVALAYPPASFLLSRLWIFSDVRKTAN
jgi:putative flippase GtrA